MYDSDYGLILYLNMNESTGAILYDQSPYGNDGAFGAGAAAPTWVDGELGKILNFDGDDDYVAVTKHSSIDGPFAKLTVMIKIYSALPAGGVPISKGAYNVDGFYFHLHNDGYVQPRFKTTVGNFYWNTPEKTFPMSKWALVTLVYNGTNVKTYIDDKLWDTEPMTGNILSSSTRDLIISGETTVLNNIAAKIAFVRMYDRDLSQNEIRAYWLYSKGMYSRSVTISDKFRILSSALAQLYKFDSVGIHMGHKYIIDSDFNHWIHCTMAGGATNVVINAIPAGLATQDRHYHTLIVSLDQAPTAGKTVTVTLSNGISTITVTITGAAVSGSSSTNEFDWDVLAQQLTLAYSQTAGGAATKGFISIKYHYKINA